MNCTILKIQNVLHKVPLDEGDRKNRCNHLRKDPLAPLVGRVQSRGRKFVSLSPKASSVLIAFGCVGSMLIILSMTM